MISPSLRALNTIYRCQQAHQQFPNVWLGALCWTPNSHVPLLFSTSIWMANKLRKLDMFKSESSSPNLLFPTDFLVSVHGSSIFIAPQAKIPEPSLILPSHVHSIFQSIRKRDWLYLPSRSRTQWLLDVFTKTALLHLTSISHQWWHNSLLTGLPVFHPCSLTVSTWHGEWCYLNKRTNGRKNHTVSHIYAEISCGFLSHSEWKPHCTQPPNPYEWGCCALPCILSPSALILGFLQRQQADSHFRAMSLRLLPGTLPQPVPVSDKMSSSQWGLSWPS